jgi:DNA-binding XRE family transcriptional regulator
LVLDEDHGTIYGTVAIAGGGADFEAETAADAIREFRNSVDDYLAACEQFGVAPGPPLEAVERAEPGHTDKAQAHKLAALMASLKEQRERLGLTQAALAEKANLPRVLVNRLENGKAPNPTLATLFAYAGAVGAELSLMAPSWVGVEAARPAAVRPPKTVSPRSKGRAG